MGISRLASSIKESPTLKLNEAARLLRAKGEPVIHLGGGEPKNKAPITAILGSAAKLNAGDVKYARFTRAYKGARRKLKGMGKEVDYLMFEDEGHDVLKHENRVRCYNAITDFFTKHLRP